MHSIALIRTQIKAGVGSQHALGHAKGLIITQYRRGEAAALHLSKLVNQHVASGHNFAFKPQAAAEQKRLAESAAIGKFGKIQLDAFDTYQ